LKTKNSINRDCAFVTSMDQNLAREELLGGIFSQLNLHQMKVIVDLELDGDYTHARSWRLLLRKLFAMGRVRDATIAADLCEIFDRAALYGFTIQTQNQFGDGGGKPKSVSVETRWQSAFQTLENNDINGFRRLSKAQLGGLVADGWQDLITKLVGRGKLPAADTVVKKMFDDAGVGGWFSGSGTKSKMEIEQPAPATQSSYHLESHYSATPHSYPQSPASLPISARPHWMSKLATGSRNILVMCSTMKVMENTAKELERIGGAQKEETKVSKIECVTFSYSKENTTLYLVGANADRLEAGDVNKITDLMASILPSSVCIITDTESRQLFITPVNSTFKYQVQTVMESVDVVSKINSPLEKFFTQAFLYEFHRARSTKIKGLTLLQAVEQVEKEYGGKVPMPESDKARRDYFRTILLTLKGEKAIIPDGDIFKLSENEATNINRFLSNLLDYPEYTPTQPMIESSTHIPNAILTLIQKAGEYGLPMIEVPLKANVCMEKCISAVEYRSAWLALYASKGIACAAVSDPK